MIEQQLEAYRAAEVGLLGSILIDADYCLAEASLIINEDDFVSPPFKNLWNIIMDLHRSNTPVDAYVVKSRAGGMYQDLIDGLIVQTPTAANWEAYAKELKRHSKLLRSSKIASDFLEESNGNFADTDSLREKAEQLVTVLENSDNIKNEFTLHEMVKAFLDDMQKEKKYLDWGSPTFNQSIMCEAGDYILIGATPSTGKTALALQLAIQIAKSGKKVMFFSYETTSKKLMERVMACQGHISYQLIKNGIKEDNKATWKEITDTSHRIYKLPFTVVESAGMTVDDIRSKAIRFGADVIFIDYIQQVAHKNEKLTEFQRVTEVSRAIQQLCQKYKITTVALSQFSRLPEGKKPVLSSFRSSGQLEQDINVGILFYRPEELQEGEEDTKRILEIAKNKDGKLGKIRLYFDGDYQTFTVQEGRY